MNALSKLGYIFILCFFFLVNCLAFTEGNINNYKDLTISYSGKPKRIVLDSEWAFTINNREISEKFQSSFREKSNHSLIKNLEDTGLVNIVKDTEEFDYKLKTSFSIKKSSNYGYNFISALTLLILPSIYTDTYNLKFELFDKEGKR